MSTLRLRGLGKIDGTRAARDPRNRAWRSAHWPTRILGMPSALPACDPDAPLRIEIVRPRALSGVTVARCRSDARSHRSVKDRFASISFTAGQSEWRARGRTWTAKPGALALMLPGEVHREERRDGPARFQVVLFNDALVNEARLSLGGRPFAPRPGLFLERGEPEGAPLLTLHALVDEGDAEPLALQTALAESLRSVVALTSPGRAERGRPYTWRAPLRRAFELIRERFVTALSLDEIALHVGLDKFQLIRAFRDQLGVTPYAYVTQLRIGRARALLTRGVPPSEIAARVGLYDQSQLNRHFKRIVGVTPGQFARAVV
ncbi:helix-turn-helix domain-containing protein [Sorangium cellulosum]|uniref:helix-turn-helix domain-containing protein n=1 Tax=Sorangium cellulosum TaxID=56 RepID=UPI003D9AB56D